DALGRLQHIGVERTRLLDRGAMRICEFGSGELLPLKAVARLRDGERGQLAHSGSSQENPDLMAVAGFAAVSGAAAGVSSPCGMTVTSHSQGCALRLASSTAS